MLILEKDLLLQGTLHEVRWGVWEIENWSEVGSRGQNNKVPAPILPEEACSIISAMAGQKVYFHLLIDDRTKEAFGTLVPLPLKHQYKPLGTDVLLLEEPQQDGPTVFEMLGLMVNKLKQAGFQPFVLNVFILGQLTKTKKNIYCTFVQLIEPHCKVINNLNIYKSV